MILKIKALIYRYTGIYLAYKEETDYIYSKEFRREFDHSLKEYKNTHPLDVMGILIGSWQAHHGFTRVWVNGFDSTPSLIRWLTVLLRTISLDIESIIYRLQKLFPEKSNTYNKRKRPK